MSLYSRVWSGEQKEIMGRLLLSLLGISTCYFATSEPLAYVYQLVLHAGVLAHVSVLGVGVMGAVMLLDTFINDILPDRFSVGWMIEARQFAWMSTGYVYICFAYVILTTRLSISLSCLFVLYAAGCFGLAFLDAAARKMPQCASK